MKKTITGFLFGLFALFSISLFSTEASAQTWRIRASRAQVNQIIRRVEDRTDRFKRQFDNALDNSRLNGTRREENLVRLADELEDATDELRREFDRRDSLAENRPEVQRTLRVASRIDSTIRARRFDRVTESNWANVRAELNALARVYGLPGVGARGNR